jgi:hypothetical protein
MDTWSLLVKELKYYGIDLINNKKCQIHNDNGDVSTYGVIKTIRILNNCVKKQKKLLLELWGDITSTLQDQLHSTEIIDDDMVNLFVFSLKDLTKYLLCFDGAEKSEYYITVSQALSKDIKMFSKDQIYDIPDYKISIDWVSRNISRLLYVCNLLSLASMGKKRVSQMDIRTAKGIAGPWSRLNLPMEERVFPFGFGLDAREKGKQQQNRYTKGLSNYNNDGRVGEGHYWRELRNEPYDWIDRDEEDPYPSRKMYTGTM